LRDGRSILLLCFVVAATEGFDLQAAGLTVGGIRSELGLTHAQVTSFLTASTLGLFVGASLGGRLSDYFSRQSVLAASVALYGAFSVLTGAGHSAGYLEVFRFLTGVGIGGALPNLIAWCAESVPQGERKKAVAWLFAGVPLGGGLASMVSYLTGASDWRLLFYAAGILPLLSVPFLLRGSPGRAQSGTAADSASASRGVMFALFGAGRALLTPVLWVAFCLMQLTSHLLLNWLPTLMQSRGFDSSHAALIQTSYGVVGALGCWVTGVFLRHFDSRVIALAVAAWLIMMLVVLGSVVESFPAVAAATGLASAGMMGCLVMNYAAAPLVYPTPYRGTGVGIAVAVGRTGSVLGPALGGVLIGAHGSFGSVLAGITPLIIVGALCSAAVMFWVDRPVGPDPIG
jgi:MFS transporter, AAHS family, 3-hydroxyphenylpropionic acid transporter